VPDEDLREIDIVSRQQWSLVVAKALITAWEPRDMALIVAAGRDEFVRVARPWLSDQDLKLEDLTRVFHIICLHTGKIPQ